MGNELIFKSINEIIPYENNPRNNEKAVDAVASSISNFGFKVPIIIDGNNVIVAGHTRLKAARKLGMDLVPCIMADDLTDDQIKAFRLADNKVSEFATWDFSKLEEELANIEMDMDSFGFDMEELEREMASATTSEHVDTSVPGSLADRFIVPPFSVLDTKQGYWQNRKRTWNTMLDSGKGRSDFLTFGDLLPGFEDKRTSVFDPVLCEVLQNWFCPSGAKVIDPFAGGSVRGIVTTMLGNEYVGVDLSEDQINANEENWTSFPLTEDFTGAPVKKPTWIHGDSCNIDTLVDGEFDFLMTCPPYADLEVYTDDPRDLSNMEYEDFKKAYFEIIDKACTKLKDDSFAAIVVGDVRDKKGVYRNFVSDTIEAFKEAGLIYYNEIILLQTIGSASYRGNKTFGSKRKVVKIHQNVLVFVKGSIDKAVDKLTPYDYDFGFDEDES